MAVTILSDSTNEATEAAGSNAIVLTIAGGDLEGTTEYLVLANGWLSGDGASGQRVRTGGLDLNPLATYVPNVEHQWSFKRVFTTAASPADMTVVLQRLGASGTARLRRASLIAIKTADLTDFVFSQESSLQDTQHSTSMVSRRDLGLLSFTNTQRYVLMACTGVQIDATNVNTEARIRHDISTVRSFHSYEGADAAEIYYTALTAVYDGTGSNERFHLETRDDGGGGKNDYEYGFICRFEIPGGAVDSSNWENGDGAQTDGDVNIGTGLTEVQGVVPTVDDSQEYLWLVAASIDVQNVGRSFTAQVQEGGTDLVTDLANIDPNDATDELPTFFAKYETALTPGTDFDLDYDLLADSTTGTPHASWRTAIALQATAGGGATKQLIGVINATGTLVGDLDRTRELVGEINATGTLVGFLGNRRTFVAGVNAVGTLVGFLDRKRGLIGGIDAVGTLIGFLDRRRGLVGVINAVGTLVAVLRGTFIFVAGVNAVGTLAGVLNRTRTFIGGIDAVGTLAGNFDVKIKLEAVINAVGTLVGFLDRRRGLVGAINAVGTLAGNLRGTFIFVAGVNAVGTLVGFLDVLGAVALSATINAVGSLTGNVAVKIALAAAVTAVGTLVGVLNRTRGLVVAVTAVGTLAGVLGRVRTFVAGIDAVGTLAGVLGAAAGYVGNDSGVSHLAASVGTPAVALFGPTNPEHFAPLGPAVATIAAGDLAEVAVGRALEALAELRRP